jgi:hypothetical protein
MMPDVLIAFFSVSTCEPFTEVSVRTKRLATLLPDALRVG